VTHFITLFYIIISTIGNKANMHMQGGSGDFAEQFNLNKKFHIFSNQNCLCKHHFRLKLRGKFGLFLQLVSVTAVVHKYSFVPLNLNLTEYHFARCFKLSLVLIMAPKITYFSKIKLKFLWKLKTAMQGLVRTELNVPIFLKHLIVSNFNNFNFQSVSKT